MNFRAVDRAYDGPGFLYLTASGLNEKLRSGMGILATEEGILMGKATLMPTGEARFHEGLFFKHPARDGETYDMAQYLRKHTGLTISRELPITIRREKLSTVLGVLDAWVYKATGRQGKTDYPARWYWAEGVGLVRQENFDTPGELWELAPPGARANSAGGAVRRQRTPLLPPPPPPPGRKAP